MRRLSAAATIVVSLALTDGAVAQTTVRDLGATGNGTTDDSAAFVAGSGPLVVPPGTYRIGSSLTVSRDLTFTFGATLLPDAGKTVQIVGDVTAPPTQRVFNGSGAIVLYGQRSPVPPEWFGARANDSTVNSAPGFQTAANALVNGGTIQAGPGNYTFGCASADAVTITGNAPINVFGAGLQSTIIRPATNCGHYLFNINPAGQSGSFRDFAIYADQLGTTAYTVDGFKCSKCGVSDFQRLAIGGLRNPFVLEYALSVHLRDLYIQQFSGTCIKFGGGSANQNGTQVASIIQGEDISCFGIAGQGGGIDFDSGANEIALYRLVQAGALRGITARNTSTGGHFPENIRLFSPNIDANIQGNIVLDDARMFEVHNGSIGSTRIDGVDTTNQSPSIRLGTGTDRGRVEGVWINATTVRGAGGSGILVQSACNVRFTNVMAYANGNNNNTNSAGIEVSGGCGGIDITDAHTGFDATGFTGWANALGQQAYGIYLSPYIPATSYTAGNGHTFPTRIKVTGCMCVGNLIAGVTDGTSVAASSKLIDKNLQ